MNSSMKHTILDFSPAADGQPWDSIDDRIMGGASESVVEVVDGILCFSGTVSLENDGGFASIRSAAGDFDLSRGERVIIRIKGDGRTYKLGMRIDVFYDGVTYLTEFATEDGQWQEVTFPLASFQPFHHGQQLTNAAPFDPAEVKSFVLLIGGGQEGPFRLDLDWVKVA